MKKVFMLVMLLVSAFALFACKSSDYKVDGVFLAFEESVHYNAPQVVMVSVTIEDGEIVGYNIDTRQGTKTQTAGADTPDDTTDDTWSFGWKDKTKKELGDDYGMATEAGQLEWYEQAEALEAHWLANGVSLDEVDADGNIDAVTGVTITVDDYYNLALEAIELAKEGKFQAVYCSSDDLTFASMKVNEKGEVSDLFLDVLQGRPSGSTFVFRDQTKQELGNDYGMATAAGQLEWFEQANALTDYILANGWTMNSTPEVAGVTVTTDSYFVTFDQLFTYAGSSVK
jgi:major membrane immunogen (membrane-anchored lipoprotein)